MEAVFWADGQDRHPGYEDRRHIEEEQIFVRTGDQGDPSFLRKVIEEFGAPDIVFDDGSHLMKHVNASFDVLYPLMSPKGIYLVEDLSTAYWPEAGGGYLRRLRLSNVQRSVDELNAQQSHGAVSETDFGRSAFSIAFYDMLIVIEKTPYINKRLLYLPDPEARGNT